MFLICVLIALLAYYMLSCLFTALASISVTIAFPLFSVDVQFLALKEMCYYCIGNACKENLFLVLPLMGTIVMKIKHFLTFCFLRFV